MNFINEIMSMILQVHSKNIQWMPYENLVMGDKI